MKRKSALLLSLLFAFLLFCGCSPQSGTDPAPPSNPSSGQEVEPSVSSTITPPSSAVPVLEEEPLFTARGTVALEEEAIFHSGMWYLTAEQTEGRITLSMKSPATHRTLSRFHLDTPLSIADAACFRNGLVVLSLFDASALAQGKSTPYEVVAVDDAFCTTLISGEMAPLASLAPRFAVLDEVTILLLAQDETDGSAAYLLGCSGGGEVWTLPFPAEGAFISVDAKVCGDSFCTFMEQENRAHFETFQYTPKYCTLVSDILMEDGAKLISYALSPDRLHICQQQPTDSGNSYTLVTYALSTGETLARVPLGQQPLSLLFAWDTQHILCRTGDLAFQILDGETGGLQDLPFGSGTQEPLHCTVQGNACYLTDPQTGERYSAGDAPYAPEDTSRYIDAKEMAEIAVSMETERHLDIEQTDDMTILMGYGSGLFPSLPISDFLDLSAIDEPAADFFTYYFMMCHEGYRYNVSAHFSSSRQELLSWNISKAYTETSYDVPESLSDLLTEDVLTEIGKAIQARMADA